MKTLVIFAHPSKEESIANRTVCEELSKTENIEVRNIAELYPDFKIDAEAEQKELLEADTIVFQYPIYWMNMTPILKQWFDDVFAYGFAFGSGGFKLEGKKMLASVTTGAGEEAYPGNSMEKILFNMEGTANFCKMKYLEPVVSYGANYLPGVTPSKDPIIEIAKKHAQQVLDRLK